MMHSLQALTPQHISFRVNDDRTGFVLDGNLADGVADKFNEADSLIFAKNFGRITDMEIGPDGYLYVLTIKGIEGTIDIQSSPRETANPV